MSTKDKDRIDLLERTIREDAIEEGVCRDVLRQFDVSDSYGQYPLRAMVKDAKDRIKQLEDTLEWFVSNADKINDKYIDRIVNLEDALKRVGGDDGV